MRFFLIFSIFLAAIPGFAAKYRSELINFSGVKAQTTTEFDNFDITESQLRVGVKFNGKTLSLQFTSTSDDVVTFLPLDLNLGTKDNRCSIKKADFEKSYTLQKNKPLTFKYKFFCAKESEAFLTVNGLKKNGKQFPLNFHFLQN